MKMMVLMTMVDGDAMKVKHLGQLIHVYALTVQVRGAPRYQIRSFFEHRSKGGGVISMFKNFGANFV